jgi:hypothetical protein
MDLGLKAKFCMVTAAEVPLTGVEPACAEVAVAVAGADVGAVVAVGDVLLLALVVPQPATNNARMTTPRMPGARNRRVVWDFKDIECLLLVGNCHIKLMPGKDALIKKQGRQESEPDKE